MANTTFVNGVTLTDAGWFNDVNDFIYEGLIPASSILADPNADRILFWDDSAGRFNYLTAGTGLNITGTTLSTTFTLSDGDYGDITVSSSGSVWTIDNKAVTYAKIQDVSNTDRLLGRISGGSGVIEEIPITDFVQTILDDADAATVRSTIGAAGSTTTITIAGTANEITSSAGAQDLSANRTWTLSLPSAIDLGGKTTFEIPNSNAPTLNATGQIAVDASVADFSHGMLKYYAGEELTVIAMPTANLNSPTDDYVVTYNSTNDEFELAAASGGGLSDGDKGDITVSGTGATWTIDNNVVTYAKMQDVTTNRLLGRATAGSGDTEEITLGTNLSFTGTTLNVNSTGKGLSLVMGLQLYSA